MPIDFETQPIQPLERVDGSVFGTVIDTYRQSGFDAGYRRAANDLLADFLLLASRLRHDLGNGTLREQRLLALREFEQQLERAADGGERLGTAHTYVDGGLGI